MADWRDQAACATEDPELFFSDHPGDRAVAKTVCAGCPSVQPCLDWALTVGRQPGVWGMTDEREREAIRKRSCPSYLAKLRRGA